MTLIRALQVFIAACCASTAVYSNEYSKSFKVDHLFEEADLAALITVKSGEKLTSFFEIQGVIGWVLKGRTGEDAIGIKFQRSVLYEPPNRLGAVYLVHLKKLDSGLFEPLEIHGSVIELSNIDKNRPDFDKAIQRLGLLENDYVAKDDIAWYPTACSYSDNKSLCGSYVDILRFSIKRIGTKQ